MDCCDEGKDCRNLLLTGWKLSGTGRQSRDRMRERKVYQIHEYYNRRVEKIREGHIPDH